SATGLRIRPLLRLNYRRFLSKFSPGLHIVGNRGFRLWRSSTFNLTQKRKKELVGEELPFVRGEGDGGGDFGGGAGEGGGRRRR
ncbi:hypothetical protein LINPERHAP1_LOCUS24981, partial [Linum perenne]